VAAFLISLFAVWVATRPASSSATWGYHRYEVFGALGSVALIWILTGILCVEAITRLLNPEPVDGKVMFITATAGLVVNLCMMKILHQGHGHSHGGGHSHGSGHSHGGGHSHGEEPCESSIISSGGSAAAAEEEENLNVRAAFIHVLGDLVQSIGVMIAAAVIWAVPEASIADPICTFVFSVLVLFTTTGIIRSAVGSLMNGVPAHISLPALVRELTELPGVSNVHDLHVWAFGTTGDKGKVSMSVHLVADNSEAALKGAMAIAGRHGIKHSTIQVERCGSEDVNACSSSNTHDGCALEVYEPGHAPRGSFLADLAAAAMGRSHESHAASRRTAGQREPLFRLTTPSSEQRHLGRDGVSHTVRAPYAPPLISASASVQGSEAHGHSHAGGGHGHSHGAGGSCTSAAPSASSAPGASSSYVAPAVSFDSHGHSHAAHSGSSASAHGHSHGASAAAAHHGHSHGSSPGHKHSPAAAPSSLAGEESSGYSPISPR
jgi:zinc transporter 2